MQAQSNPKLQFHPIDITNREGQLKALRAALVQYAAFSWQCSPDEECREWHEACLQQAHDALDMLAS